MYMNLFVVVVVTDELTVYKVRAALNCYLNQPIFIPLFSELLRMRKKKHLKKLITNSCWYIFVIQEENSSVPLVVNRITPSWPKMRRSLTGWEPRSSTPSMKPKIFWEGTVCPIREPAAQTTSDEHCNSSILCFFPCEILNTFISLARFE